MGLTLHYKLRAPAGTTDSGSAALVAAMHAAAMTLRHAGRIARVGRIGAEPEELAWLSEWMQAPVPGDKDCRRGIEVPALTGRVFTVLLGEDCEPLRIGLCRYPDRVPDHQTGGTRAVRRRGWRLAGFCKTQYASLHGWEHFRRCHTAAVDLLAGLRRLGLQVGIDDEGGYWPGRDLGELRRHVEQMNGIVAAFAGALKDAADASGGAPVQSPIFAHPRFERLEAAGVARHGATIAQTVALIRDLDPKSGGPSASAPDEHP